MEDKNFTFTFDELKLQRDRKSFVDWLKKALDKEVTEQEISISCDKEGKFTLSYRQWDSTDQIVVKRICYKSTSIDTIIELNSSTYKNTLIRKI
jgi:hypothetical protein